MLRIKILSLLLLGFMGLSQISFAQSSDHSAPTPREWIAQAGQPDSQPAETAAVEEVEEEKGPLLTNNAVVFGLLIVILAFVFHTSSSSNPGWRKFLCQRFCERPYTAFRGCIGCRATAAAIMGRL